MNFEKICIVVFLAMIVVIISPILLIVIVAILPAVAVVAFIALGYLVVQLIKDHIEENKYR